MTLPEVLLWRDLRRRQLDGLLFRRQHPLGPYILDFFCPEHALAVEVDGAAHDGASRADHDERRDLWLAQRGVRVFRVPAADALSDAGRVDVLATVAAVAASSTALRTGHPSRQTGTGTLVPLLRDAEEDQARPAAGSAR